MFYDRFAKLCAEKGVSVSRGAQEAGISKSLVTKWKTNRIDVPSGDVLSKLSNYFELSISELLDENSAQKHVSETPVVDRQELKIALFKGQDHVTDSMLEEVLSFAEYIMQREERKRQL